MRKLGEVKPATLDEGEDNGTSGSTVAAILESMRAVQKALTRPPGLPPEQLVSRLKEWQRLVLELSGAPVQGSELAILYEIIGVLNSSLDLTETLELVMDSLIHLTGAERGCLMLLDEQRELEIRAAQHFDPPGEQEPGNDWVLVLDDEGRDFPAPGSEVH